MDAVEDKKNGVVPNPNTAGLLVKTRTAAQRCVVAPLELESCSLKPVKAAKPVGGFWNILLRQTEAAESLLSPGG